MKNTLIVLSVIALFSVVMLVNGCANLFSADNNSSKKVVKYTANCTMIDSLQGTSKLAEVKIYLNSNEVAKAEIKSFRDFQPVIKTVDVTTENGLRVLIVDTYRSEVKLLDKNGKPLTGILPIM